MVWLDKSTYCSFVHVPVGRGCSGSKALLHTLFHVLGRYHEHERADREKYIEIIDENIIEGKYANTCTIVPSTILSVYLSIIYPKPFMK